MPVLFGFAMTTGGPKAAFANWTMIGGYGILEFFPLAAPVWRTED